MAKPSISVVISTFNRRDGCRRAIESVIGQTLSPLEILVCDDGSTDGTKEAVAAITSRKPYVRHLGLPRNTGSPAVPRNLGLRKARGAWIAFLDDDDEWLPEKLETQASALEKGYVIVCANARKDDGAPYFPVNVGPIDFDRRLLLRENPVITSTAIVERRRLLDAGGFPTKPRLVEDHGAWLNLFDRGGIGARLNDVLVRYRSTGSDRFSTNPVAVQRAGALLSMRRWAAHPFDGDLAAATVSQSWRTVKVSLAARRSATARSKISS